MDKNRTYDGAHANHQWNQDRDFMNLRHRHTTNIQPYRVTRKLDGAKASGAASQTGRDRRSEVIARRRPRPRAQRAILRRLESSAQTGRRGWRSEYPSGSHGLNAVKPQATT